ncbi:MAG: hypothetical protein R2699_12530 [Acidimicrobiales bacterium]
MPIWTSLITTATRDLGADRLGVALAPQPDVGIDRRVVASLEPLMLLGDLPRRWSTAPSMPSPTRRRTPG